MKLVQIEQPGKNRRVGIVEDSQIVLLNSEIRTSYSLFMEIINSSFAPFSFIQDAKTGEKIDYNPVYNGASDWKILPPIDSPDNPSLTILSGTGLTHMASAVNRHKMHESESRDELTDSMKMYLMGEEGGKPQKGRSGVQPEWFYKGTGWNLKAHREPLLVPPFAMDGGEEPEIAGVYLISPKGVPVRIGFVQGNEFSDHAMEKINYLYLAPSKLRNCSIGPELVLEFDFSAKIKGDVQIIREDRVLWEKTVYSGESAMVHSLDNLEYHHFKYELHRKPGQLHVHYFGTQAFSFGDGIQLEDGDLMSIQFENMGRPLVNPIQIQTEGIVPDIEALLE